MRTIEVTSPLDGSPIGTIGVADTAAVDAAVQRAAIAFETWSRTPVKERVQPLFRFKQSVEDNIRDLSELVTSENGKTVAEAEAGIRKGLEVVEFATALPALGKGGKLEVSRGVDCFTRRYPLGVAAGITPFNFPAMVPLWMYPIALATGNTFLLKPSEQVPLTSDRIAELLLEAGLPENVFQVVHGDRETVEALLDHPGIEAAAFVGSTRIAKLVYERGIANGKRMLCLGGAKNHLIVVPDADPVITAKNVVDSATGCAGQRCMAASVLITVGDCSAVMKAIETEMEKMVPGENLGAIISVEAKERIEGYIDRAEAAGARIPIDGRGATVAGKEKGFYVGPTLIDGLDIGNECACEEIFGPVLTILHTDTLDEALAIENANPYGNAASIYTTSGATARYFEDRAGAGMIGVNIGVPVPREPFSFGGWNESRFGVGDITGEDGIRFWTQGEKDHAEVECERGAELDVMIAGIYKGKELIDVEEVADPTVSDGEVLIEIDACAVCGTDLRTYRHGDKKITPPRILGHEFCGTVVESAALGNANVAVGDRVVMYIVLPCGECRYCRQGRQNLCESRTTMSYHHDGAFAPLMKVPAKGVRNGHLFKVETDMPSDQMGLAEPLGCVINAHGRLKIGVYDTVAVIGAGPIGVMHAVVSRLQGAQKIWVLDTMENRLAMAEQFDIDGTVQVKPDGSHIERLKELTDGFGPSVVVVACSNARAQADALEIVGKGGRVEFFGGLPKSAPTAVLNTNHLHYKEIVITGSYSEKMSDFQASQALIQSGRFPADKIITHHLPIERINEAFPLMESGEALKVCIDPRG